MTTHDHIDNISAYHKICHSLRAFAKQQHHQQSSQSILLVNARLLPLYCTSLSKLREKTNILMEIIYFCFTN